MLLLLRGLSGPPNSVATVIYLNCREFVIPGLAMLAYWLRSCWFSDPSSGMQSALMCIVSAIKEPVEVIRTRRDL